MSVTTRFHVQGMKCDGCVSRANEALRTLPGFESARFDLKGGGAEVTGDVDPQAVCEALTRAGYPAVVNSG